MIAESSDTPAADQPPAGRWRRRLGRAAVALLVLGVAGAGATFGWLLRGWVPSGGVGTTTVVVKRPVVIRSQLAGHGTLPNVLGLREDEARQAYADAGVDPTAVAASEVPYVGQQGVVVRQRPLAASTIADLHGGAKLLVARPAEMPDLTGVDADEARKRLSDIGAGATTVVRYDAAVAPGAVVRTRPVAGAPATARVTLVVSEAPSSIGLAGLQPTQSDCRNGDADVAGAPVTGAVLCDVSSDAVTAEYAINGKVTGFAAKLALADGADAGARVHVVVREDRRVAGAFDLTDTSRPVSVALHGGKSLSLQLVRRDNGVDPATVVLQDARITGARSGIDALDPGSGP